MLTGGYELVHQAMGAEAKATVWEAESLARRHGHVRVTPLHVASAILSSTPAARGHLLSSSAHQLLQEDLLPCFDAALSRFPVACPPPPAATGHSHMVAPRLPLSNALVAAIKRAQMLQSRGRRRGRRRQLAADVKINPEQLVVSIMHDPGVYRAIKQAGSGSRVKSNVEEKGASLEQSSQATAARTVCQGKNLDGAVAVNLSWHRRDHAASKGKITADLAALVGQSTTAPSLPSWLYHHQAATPNCRSTSLQATCRQQKFTELSATNFKIMCDALERRVPWHKHIAPGIASAVLRCRSGMMRRARNLTSATTWLLFQGHDSYGKKEMAHELSNLIFGSNNELYFLDSSGSFDTGNHANKRKRTPEDDNTYDMSRLLDVVHENPHCVVFINDINQLDGESKIAIKNLLEIGRFMGRNGSYMVNLEDTILVLSTEEISSSANMASSTLLNRESIKDKGVESCRFSLDLNACSEDLGEEEEYNLVGDNVGIMSLVDGVFHFE